MCADADEVMSGRLKAYLFSSLLEQRGDIRDLVHFDVYSVVFESFALKLKSTLTPLNYVHHTTIT